MSLDFPRVLSQPTTIYWAGWETTTERLQRFGWQLSAHEEPRRHMLGLTFKWGNVAGTTEFVDFDYHQHHRNMPMRGTRTNLRFGVHSMGDRRYVYPPAELFASDINAEYWPIDAAPAFSTREINGIEDYAVFRKVNMDAKQIFLKETDVSTMLELAVEKQRSSADKFRKRMLRDQEIARDSKLQAEIRLIA